MKTSTLCAVLILFFFLGFISPALPQLNVTVKKIGNNIVEETIPEGVSASYYVNDNDNYSKSFYDYNEDVNIIIQFKEPPLSSQSAVKQNKSANSGPVYRSKIENEHLRFRNALSGIESSVLSRSGKVLQSANNKIRFEYYSAVNGVSLSTKRWMVEEIRKLQFVKAIFEDKEVNALDTETNHVIGADSIWAKLNITGKGIKICILDTGIDYKHPDLGGGIGNGFKIYGGYDLINSDNNPMDDHGHGTHVAGIAAANGSILKGTAPDALLYACKVLDQDGRGPVSTVIAGLERALDPDQNPYTDDAVDIINVSLGSGGEPDDIISQAVNNIVSAGVICVVAAGNSGSHYSTINSPGCAKNALTVGATDNSDNIAAFSSRGPTNKAGTLKPDLMAPGVKVHSSKAGGGYVQLDGTSMATPHVAGCAALLLQMHPDWTPAMIKSALMCSAEDIGNDVWTQGSGRVDMIKAASQSSLIIPPSLSFGLVDINKEIWTKADTFSVYNTSDISETYNFSVLGELIPGVNLVLSSNQLFLDPGQSGMVTVTLTVDNNLVPFFNSTPPAFSKKLLVQSSSQSLEIPLTFVKSPALNITLDDGVKNLVIMGRNLDIYPAGNPGNFVSFLLPKGTYDLCVEYTDLKTRIIKENIFIENITNISVNKAEAKNKIVIPMEDETGKKLITGYRQLEIAFIIPRFHAFHFDVLPLTDTLYFSDFSKNVAVDWANVNFEKQNKIYRSSGGTFGLTGDLILPATKNSYRQLKFSADLPASNKEISFNEQVCSWGILGGADAELELKSGPKLAYPFIQDGFYAPAPNDSCSVVYFKKIIPAVNITSPYYKLNGFNTTEAYFLFEFSNPLFNTTSSEIPLNVGPPHLSGNFLNSNGKIRLRSHNLNKLFFNQSQDYHINQVDFLKYELYSNSGLLQQGNMKNILANLEDYSIDVPSGEYRLKIFNVPESKVNGAVSEITTDFYFDTREFYRNPPTLKSLNVLSDGRWTNKLDVFKENQIEFALSGSGGLNHVQLDVRSIQDSEWTSLPLINSNSLYNSVIPSSLKKGNMSVRITAIDNNNNKMVYTAEPAFLYGVNHPPVVESVTNTLAREDYFYSGLIIAGDVDGNSLIYGLDSGPSWMAIDSLTGTLSGVPKAKDVGTTNITVSVNDGNGGEVKFQFSLQVQHTNHAPLIAVIKDTSAFEDSLYTLQVPAEDIDNDLLKFKLDIRPSWIMIDSIKGLISGIPTALNLGDTIICVKAEDGFGGEAKCQYTLHVYHVNHAPYISVLTDTIAIEDSLFVRQIKSQDPDGDPVTYFLDQKPIWLDVDSSSGIITGTPSANDLGESTVIAGAVDHLSKKSFQKFNIFVQHTNHSPSVFRLSEPGNNDTIKLYVPVIPVSFAWTKSADADKQDTLKYKFQLEGPNIDTLITGIKDTIIHLNIMAFLTQGSVYRWSVDVSDGYIWNSSDTSFFYTDIKITSADDPGELPSTYFLSNNFPNPFNPATSINYSVPVSGSVSICIYDLLGRMVKELVNEDKAPGNYKVVFDASQLASGIYVYYMKSGSYAAQKKMIYLK